MIFPKEIRSLRFQICLCDDQTLSTGAGGETSSVTVTAVLVTKSGGTETCPSSAMDSRLSNHTALFI